MLVLPVLRCWHRVDDWNCLLTDATVTGADVTTSLTILLQMGSLDKRERWVGGVI